MTQLPPPTVPPVGGLIEMDLLCISSLTWAPGLDSVLNLWLPNLNEPFYHLCSTLDALIIRWTDNTTQSPGTPVRLLLLQQVGTSPVLMSASWPVFSFHVAKQLTYECRQRHPFSYFFISFTFSFVFFPKHVICQKKQKQTMLGRPHGYFHPAPQFLIVPPLH